MNQFTHISLFVVQGRNSETDAEAFEPTFHTCYEDGLNEIWGFVTDRILSCYTGIYADECMGEDEVDCKVIEAHLKSCSDDRKEEVIDWYFAMEDDCETQAFYYITEIAA